MAKKLWSKTIEESGVRVRVYARARSSYLWFSIADGRGGKERGSLKTGDKKLAEERARAVAREVARHRLDGTTPDSITLGEIFAAYFRLKAPGLSETWREHAQYRSRLYLECWGPEKKVVDVSQTDVDRYSRQRRSGELAPPRKGKDASGVRDGTIDGDFRWLSSVFNWGRKHKVNGKRLLQENPLHDVEWPKESNPRRPVASHQRFQHTMAHVDDVDPEGRLRCILALARYTGRREGAICALRASDVLRTPEAVRVALARAGMDERMAEHMPDGAIRWSDESDKMGLLFISPISPDARAALDQYLQAHPRLGDVPLFPAPEDPSQPIRRDVTAKWLLKAEKAAGLPKLRGGIWHPYRRLWASERKHESDTDVAAAGGWKDTRALKQSYQQADPASVLRVVRGK